MIIDKKINTKTTILITTKDRPFCLLRLLKFLENFSETFNIIVLDSSIKKCKKNKIYLKNGIKVKYYYYKSNITFSYKIFEGLKKVKTKYSVLCPVDDFIFPSKFKLFKNFLEKNPKYITVVGSAFNHSFPFQTKLSNFFFEEIYKKATSNESDSPEKRIKNYFYKKKGTIVYGYYKTSKLRQFYSLLKNIDHEYMQYYEYFANIIPLYVGKVKFIPSFFFSREPNEPFPEKIQQIDINNVKKFIAKIIKFYLNKKLISLIKNGLLFRMKMNLNNRLLFLNYLGFILKKKIQIFLSIFFKYKIKSDYFKIITDNNRLKITTNDIVYMKKITELIIESSKEVEKEISISRKLHWLEYYKFDNRNYHNFTLQVKKHD